MKEEAKEKALELYVLVLSMMPNSLEAKEKKQHAKTLTLTCATEIRSDCSALTRMFWDTVISEIKQIA